MSALLGCKMKIGMKISAISAAIVLSLATQANQAGVITIDFEQDSSGTALPAGTVVSTHFSGITISSESPNHPPMIFDSGNPTGGDTDLVTPGPGTNNDTGLGNILIISEDQDSSDPDDNASGGTLVFDFANPVTLLSIDILDMDDPNGRDIGGTVSLLDASGITIGSIFEIPNLGDNSFQTLSFGTAGTAGVDKMKVWLRSSGAIPAFTYDDGVPPPDTSISVPTPNVLALLAIGMAGSLVRRSRRKSVCH